MLLKKHHLHRNHLIYQFFHYYKLLDWGVMKNYEEKAVWKSTHKNFTEFKSIWKDFEKTINPENTTHNLLGVL